MEFLKEIITLFFRDEEDDTSVRFGTSGYRVGEQELVDPELNITCEAII